VGLITALGVTGWMARLDAFWGDDWLIDLHQGLANVLLGCVAVHLAGVVLMPPAAREPCTGHAHRTQGQLKAAGGPGGAAKMAN
jgi:cytochrome b